MTIPKLARYALSVCAAVIFAGCSESQGPTATNPSLSAPPSESHSSQDFSASSVALHPKYEGLNDLYVADFGASKIEILNNDGYSEVGKISKGIDGPLGDFLDQHGNLYVANHSGKNIAEYKSGGRSPSFTYSAGMNFPENVSGDTHGNVFETDAYGSVNEYANGSNAVINTCRPIASGFPGVNGVAVDKAGDVFVNAGGEDGLSGVTTLGEYIGGLNGCSETALSLGSSFIAAGGGMVLDKRNDIIVCDTEQGVVDVIDPPYTSVTRSIGVKFLNEPTNVTLNKKNDRMFVADEGNNVVYVVDYPSGRLVATLGSRNGLSEPIGAVDGPNAVY